jgi:hypothetical protein
VIRAAQHLDYELRLLWLFAPSWTGDIEHVDDVIVQESFQPLRGVWHSGMNVDTWFVVLPRKLNRFL